MLHMYICYVVHCDSPCGHCCHSLVRILPTVPSYQSRTGWSSWSKRHTEPIGFHTRITNLSIYLELQHSGDKNGDYLDRYHHARYGNPNPAA